MLPSLGVVSRFLCEMTLVQHHKCEWECLGDISVTHKNIDFFYDETSANFERGITFLLATCPDLT
jgi:hypothetical protein